MMLPLPLMYLSYIYFFNFISDNTAAESKIQENTIYNNDRQDSLVINDHFEVVGMNYLDAVKADKYYITYLILDIEIHISGGDSSRYY